MPDSPPVPDTQPRCAACGRPLKSDGPNRWMIECQCYPAVIVPAGPTAGTYGVRRAPVYLRAVVGSVTGEADVLDQLTDTPSKGEDVSVYQLASAVGTVHLNRGRKGSGFYVMADYVHRPDVDGEAMRANETWSEWATAQPPTIAKLTPAPPGAGGEA